MRKIITTLVIFISFSMLLNAQDYRTGIGLRAGYPAGLTVKHFVNERTAVEGMLATRWGGFVVTGLFEAHRPLADVNNLKWFYGAGAHIGFWNSSSSRTWGNSGTSYTVVGIDGILGVEYSFGEIPINIGLDWKPAFNIIGYSGVWADGAAFSIRYIF
ncbi:MAG TPA: hypothetical protein VHO50_06030 [Bacteroidales bacterium]|nr:hypothetical protein [Bacteroidales bacterium]